MSAVSALLATIASLALFYLSLVVGMRLSMLLNRMEQPTPVGAVMLGYFTISTILHFAVLSGRFHLLAAVTLIPAGLWSLVEFPRVVKLIREQAADTAVTIAVGLAVTALIVWPSVNNAAEIFDQGGLLLAHIDLFHHGAVVSQLAKFGSGPGSNIFLAGFDAPFYHYGFYAVPAIIAMVSDVNGTLLVLYGALAFGCLLLFFSLVGLTRIFLPNRSIACLVIPVASIVLFDPTRDFFFQNHLFDKTFLVNASPGVPYGTAVVIWAAATVLKSRSAFWPTVVLSTAFLFAFRANFLPLLWLLIILLKIQQLLDPLLSRRSQIICLLAAAVAGLATSGPLLDAIGSTPAAKQLFEFMQTFVEPPAWRDMAANRSLTLMTASIALSMLGVSLSLLVLLAWIFQYWERPRAWPGCGFLICIVLVANLGVVAVSWVPANGDFTELNQRLFLVSNAMITTFALCAIWSSWPSVAIAAIGLALAGWVSAGRENQDLRPIGFPFDHPWHRSSYKVDVKPELIALARSLKTSTDTSAYVFVPVVKDGYSFFPEGLVTAISERPALLSRTGHYTRMLSGTAGKALTSRIDIVDRLTRCDVDLDDLKTRLRSLGRIISETEIPCLEQTQVYGPYRVYRLPDFNRPP